MLRDHRQEPLAHVLADRVADHPLLVVEQRAERERVERVERGQGGSGGGGGHGCQAYDGRRAPGVPSDYFFFALAFLAGFAQPFGWPRTYGPDSLPLAPATTIHAFSAMWFDLSRAQGSVSVSKPARVKRPKPRLPPVPHEKPKDGMSPSHSPKRSSPRIAPPADSGSNTSAATSNALSLTDVARLKALTGSRQVTHTTPVSRSGVASMGLMLP